MSNSEQTIASLFLKAHPNIRASIINSQEFLDWKQKLPKITIDGITNYLLGGPVSTETSLGGEDNLNHIINPGADHPIEEDELILLWAKLNGLVTKAEIDDINN